MKKVLKYLFFSVFLSSVAFMPTNLWCMEQKPICLDEAQTFEEMCALPRIIELRANAMVCIICESIERSNTLSISMEKRDAAISQTRKAVNNASTAYLMASESCKQQLDRLEKGAIAAGAFTYTHLEKIVKNDVLKLEEINAENFSKNSLQFQFSAIAQFLDVKDRCQEKPFLVYVTFLQTMYSDVAKFLYLDSKVLFLEELSLSPYIIGLFFDAYVRNIIDLAANAEVSLPSLKYSSPVIKKHRENQLQTIAQAKEMACAKLFSVAEIKNLILKALPRDLLELLSPVLIDRLLSLADAGNEKHLIHYMQIWDKKSETVSGGAIEAYFSYLNSTMESFKQIFSGTDCEKIWPNLVAKLTELESEVLIKPENSIQTPELETCVARKTVTTPSIAPASRELSQIGKKLLAEENGKERKKRKEAKVREEERIAEAERKAKEARKVEQACKSKEEHKSDAPKSKKKKKNNKTQQTEISSPCEQEPVCEIKSEQPLLSSSTTDSCAVYSFEQDCIKNGSEIESADVQVISPNASKIFATSTSSVSPIDQFVQIQSSEIEEACVTGSDELQLVSNWGEPENAQDQFRPDYNCIVDLSRRAEGPSYECKIFLYPECAMPGSNLLANLDYSKLLKYKNPRDNNHAFSNLVEKRFGHLGTIVKTENLKNGWLKLYITFPGRFTWMGHAMQDAFSQGSVGSNGTFEFIVLKKDMNPASYACCVHRFFRPN